MRSIGDVVWIPIGQVMQIPKQCPDCLGTARWHVILPSKEEFDVECPRCYPGGYLASTGVVMEDYSFVTQVVNVVITGVRMNGGNVEYTTSDNHCFGDQADICDTETQATERCKVKMDDYCRQKTQEMARIAKSKGRPRKGDRGQRIASDDSAIGYVQYARGEIRSALKKAFEWAAFSLAKGAKSDVVEMATKMLDGVVQ